MASTRVHPSASAVVITWFLNWARSATSRPPRPIDLSRTTHSCCSPPPTFSGGFCPRLASRWTMRSATARLPTSRCRCPTAPASRACGGLGACRAAATRSGGVVVGPGRPGPPGVPAVPPGDYAPGRRPGRCPIGQSGGHPGAVRPSPRDGSQQLDAVAGGDRENRRHARVALGGQRGSGASRSPPWARRERARRRRSASAADSLRTVWGVPPASGTTSPAVATVRRTGPAGSPT